MWKKRKYYSHPHDLGEILLQEWGDLWTIDCGPKLATRMWARLKILIKHSRGKGLLDKITPENAKRGIEMMNSGTAVGIDQWSHSTGNNLVLRPLRLLLTSSTMWRNMVYGQAIYATILLSSWANLRVDPGQLRLCLCYIDSGPR